MRLVHLKLLIMKNKVIINLGSIFLISVLSFSVYASNRTVDKQAEERKSCYEYFTECDSNYPDDFAMFYCCMQYYGCS